MPSTSILFAQTPDTAPTGQPEPAFFVDLNLDQIVAGVTAGRADYDLEEFYRAPLDSTQAIRYRQQVFQDLERNDLRDRMGDFADTMTRVRQRLAQAADLHYPTNGNAGTWTPQPPTVMRSNLWPPTSVTPTFGLQGS